MCNAQTSDQCVSLSTSPYCSVLLQTLATQSDYINCLNKNWNAFSYLTDISNSKQCKNEFEWIQATSIQAHFYSLVASNSARSIASRIMSKSNRHSLNTLKMYPKCSYGSSSHYEDLSKKDLFQNAITSTSLTKPTASSSNASTCGVTASTTVSTATSSSTTSNKIKSTSSISSASSNLSTTATSLFGNASGEGDTPPEWKKVSICVLDDARGSQETFTCSWEVLTKEMPYFDQCLNSEQPEGEVQISVHCDLEVFKKLMAYITKDSQQQGAEPFSFDPKYAIHLLVSADFLQMKILVDECLIYCHKNMNSILETSCPISALNDSLIERIAILFTHSEVEALVDPLDKIKSRLYRKLVDYLMKSSSELPKEETTKLYKCAICNKIFASKLQTITRCKSRRYEMNQRGQLIFYHKRDPNFNQDEYIRSLYEKLGSWKSVYWRMWGIATCLYCNTCRKEFSCCDYIKCRYHPDHVQYPPVNEQQKISHLTGKYPCCGRKCWKFDPLDPLGVESGCQFRHHTVLPNKRNAHIFQDLIAYQELIFLPRSDNTDPSKEDLERVSPCFGENMISVWSKTISLPNRASSSHSSHSDDNSAAANNTGSSGTSFALAARLISKGIHSRNELKARKASAAIGGGNGGAELTRQYSLTSCLLSSLGQMSGKPTETKKVWNPNASLWHNQDVVRECDSHQMDLLLNQLQKIRGIDRH